MAALEEAVLPFDEPDAPTDVVYLGMLVVAMCLVAVDLGRLGDARIFAEEGHRETVDLGHRAGPGLVRPHPRTGGDGGG